MSTRKDPLAPRENVSGKGHSQKSGKLTRVVLQLWYTFLMQAEMHLPIVTRLIYVYSIRLRIHSIKGNIRTISSCRNRFDFQILAYLVTIHLLYALDAYHIDSVNTCYD